MAGILDSKQRIMDVLVTAEGRAQAAAGEFSIKFASFTDRHAFYETDSPSSNKLIANDASSRIYFECASRHQDQIVIETIDGGAIKPFRSTDFDLSTPQVARFFDNVTSTFVSSSNFITSSDAIISTIMDSFNEQQIIGTNDPFSDSTDFIIDPEKIAFEINERQPFNTTRPDAILELPLENIESIFQDKRFSHLPNFVYLPPRNKPRLGQQRGGLMGNYVNWNQRAPTTLQELMQDLQGKEYRDVEFIDTSRDNNLVIQPFEFTESEVKKLCVVDFGEFPGDSSDSLGKRVFFVGKLYKDSNGFSTFVNIFTVVME